MIVLGSSSELAHLVLLERFSGQPHVNTSTLVCRKHHLTVFLSQSSRLLFKKDLFICAYSRELVVDVILRCTLLARMMLHICTVQSTSVYSDGHYCIDFKYLKQQFIKIESTARRLHYFMFASKSQSDTALNVVSASVVRSVDEKLL